MKLYKQVVLNMTSLMFLIFSETYFSDAQISCDVDQIDFNVNSCIGTVFTGQSNLNFGLVLSFMIPVVKNTKKVSTDISLKL